MGPDYYTNGILQVKAYRILQANIAATVRRHGLGSVSEWFVLSHVYHTPDVIAKDLAALLEVEAPLITRLVGNLTDQGLVIAENDQKDKRVKYLRPSRRAHELVPQVQTDVAVVVDDLLTGVADTDMSAYGRVLGAIIHNGSAGM